MPPSCCLALECQFTVKLQPEMSRDLPPDLQCVMIQGDSHILTLHHSHADISIDFYGKLTIESEVRTKEGR